MDEAFEQKVVITELKTNDSQIIGIVFGGIIIALPLIYLIKRKRH